MPKYAWVILNKQDSEYAYGTKYAKILNLAGFLICERFTVFRVCQNIPCLTEFWIYLQGICPL